MSEVRKDCNTFVYFGKEIESVDGIIDRLGLRLKPLSSIDFDSIFEANEHQVKEATVGNKKAINFLMGQVMKNNNVDPAGAKELLIKKLGEM